MRLLVLGGSGFLGRHVVGQALDRGWDVTTFNRGRAANDPRAAHVAGDRLDPADLAPLAAGRWDAVVDTWSGDAEAVRLAAEVLEPVVARWLYVSSASVYDDLEGEEPGYAGDKRRAELHADRVLGVDRVLHARAGLLLGPGEDIGRLPWWLTRLAAGGPTVAPGPPELAVQLLDARDLAAFLLDQAGGGRTGPLDVAGEGAPMRTILEAARDVTGARAELVWFTPAQLADAEPWTGLPLWLPPGHESRWILELDTAAAAQAGLRSRPVAETVADTWAWLRAVGTAPQRVDRPTVGLDPALEQDLLQAFTAR